VLSEPQSVEAKLIKLQEAVGTTIRDLQYAPTSAKPAIATEPVTAIPR
jgi:hypothetical protein